MEAGFCFCFQAQWGKKKDNQPDLCQTPCPAKINDPDVTGTIHKCQNYAMHTFPNVLKSDIAVIISVGIAYAIG